MTIQSMISIFLLLSLPFIEKARALSDTSDRENLIDEVDKSKSTLSEQEEKQKRVLTALYSLNNKIHKVLSDKALLDEERISNEDALGNLKAELVELTKDRERQKKELLIGLRLRYLLLGGRGLELALSSSSVSDIDRRMRFLDAITKKSLVQIQEFSRSMAKVEMDSKAIEKRLEKLTEVDESIRKKEKSLAKQQALKSNILSGIKNKRLFLHTKLAELKEKSEKLGIHDIGIIDSILRPSFAELQGLLRMPVNNGILLRDYGPYKISNEFNLGSHMSYNMKGLFLKSEPSSYVIAVSEGTIDYTGDIPGLNNVIIINHGDHYYSVYGNLSDLKVKFGEAVKQNQLIALSNYSRLENADGVYFEIRHFSESYNPLQWIRGQKL